MAESAAAAPSSTRSAGPTTNASQLTRRLSSSHLTIQLYPHQRTASTDATQQLLHPVLDEVQHRLQEEAAPQDTTGLHTYTTCTQTGSRNMHWPLEYYGSPGFRLQYIQTLYSKRVMELLGAFKATLEQPGGKQLWSAACTTWLDMSGPPSDPSSSSTAAQFAPIQGATAAAGNGAEETTQPSAAASSAGGSKQGGEGCNLKVVSVGGGPGSDLFAAAAFIKDLPRKLELLHPEQLQVLTPVTNTIQAQPSKADAHSLPDGDTSSTCKAPHCDSTSSSSGVSSAIASSIVSGAAGLKTQLTCLDAEAGWEGVVTTSLDTLSDAPPQFREAAFEDELSFSTCQEADVVLFSFVLGDFPVAAALVERLVAAWQPCQGPNPTKAWPRLICIADRFPVGDRFRVPPGLRRVTVHVQHEGERRTWLQVLLVEGGP